MVTNEELFGRASRVIPGGVNSPVRAFRSVGGTPYFVASGKGSRVTDVEGRAYIDYVQSYGASILGHAHPAVVEAVQRAAEQGTTYGAPTEREVELAEAITARVPDVEMVRLVSSGTEALMSAVRLARGATGRDTVLMFAGCYHGHSDSLLAAGGSGMANQGIPGTAGVTKAAVADTVVVPYGVVPEIGDDVAVVLVEPVAGNMGLVDPDPAFLTGLRAACDRAGALLLFDEVITGFRLGVGGATERSGVSPDLWTFGKVIGGGFPLAAFAGRRDVMEQLAPVGPVYQAGTLSGNPVATAAGLAVLDQLDVGTYTTLEKTATALADGLRDAITAAGLPVQVPRAATLVGLHFSDQPVRNYDDAKAAADSGLYREFFTALLARGVAFAPGAYEALFPSLAHSNDDIDRTIEAAAAAAGEVARARG
jgi:glutamate-1-semialdehyde 2,1-aminomutase